MFKLLIDQNGQYPHLDLHVVQLAALLNAQVPILSHRDHARLRVDHKVVLAPTVNGKPGKKILLVHDLNKVRKMRDQPDICFDQSEASIQVM